jgi:hypothetical protein
LLLPIPEKNMNSDTYWLNMTNLALGVVTAIAVLIILRAVVVELVARRRQS